MSEQIDLFPVRSTDPLQVSPEDRTDILEHLAWWQGKSMQDITNNALPPDILLEEECALYTIGSRDSATGHITPNYERLLSEGLEGYIGRCRQKIGEVVGGSKEAQEKINFWKAASSPPRALSPTPSAAPIRSRSSPPWKRIRKERPSCLKSAISAAAYRVKNRPVSTRPCSSSGLFS